MAESAINFPKPDHVRVSFHMWAARYFDDDLRDPLRRRPGGYYHQRVNDAWEAWKVADEVLARENDRLRKLLEEISKHTLNMPIMTDPGKIA